MKLFTWPKKQHVPTTSEIVDGVYALLAPQIRKLTYDVKILQNDVNKIKVDLRPPMRLRLEQLDTALKIQVKFLNEIWDEVKSHGG